MPGSDKVKGRWTRNALLSISIDLCNSTSIKQEIVASSDADQQYRSRLYASYVLHFFNIERQFYYQVMHQEDLDIRRLLLIKIIGDEYWFVYEVNTEETEVIKRTAAAFFRALIGTVQNSPPFDIPDRYLSAGEAEDPENKIKVRHLDTPLKAFVDLIGEPAEVNMARFEYLKGHLPRFLGHKAGNYRIDEDFIELCKRLNLANITVDDNHMTKQIRPDFIGLDVDRFFRLTKFCRPRVLTVGDSLMRNLTYKTKKTPQKLGDVDVRLFQHETPKADGTGVSVDESYIASEAVSAADMKGLSRGYTVHHLF